MISEPGSQAGRDRLRVEIDFGSRSPSRAAGERRLLQTRCGCARLPLRVDGQPVARGWSWIFGDPAQVGPRRHTSQFEIPIRFEGRTIGTAGYHLSERRDAFVRVLVNGVEIEDIPIDTYAGFRAVVEIDLRRDLSQGKLLRDLRFAAMLDAVREAATEAEPRRDDLPWAGPRVEPTPWWSTSRRGVWALGFSGAATVLFAIANHDEVALSSALVLFILMWMASTLIRDK